MISAAPPDLRERQREGHRVHPPGVGRQEQILEQLGAGLRAEVGQAQGAARGRLEMPEAGECRS